MIKMKRICQNLNRLLLYITVLYLSFCLSSCTGNEGNLGADNEEFIGTYTARDLSEVIELASVDSVSFTVRRGTTYSLRFFEGANSQDAIDFCNHDGTILDFGTAKASFDPTSISYQNCDTAAIPRGTFVADFINHGDTVFISKQSTDTASPPVYDSMYILKLLKKL